MSTHFALCQYDDSTGTYVPFRQHSLPDEKFNNDLMFAAGAASRDDEIADQVKDIDLGATRHEEKLRDKLFIAAFQKLVQFCGDGSAGVELMNKSVQCANAWADAGMRGRKP